MSLFPTLMTVALDTLPATLWQSIDVDLTYDELSAWRATLNPLTIADELAMRNAWAATVMLNGKPLLIGTVDQVEVDERRGGAAHAIGGRERGAGAADCDCEDQTDYTGLPLPTVATKILAPHGLTVLAGPTAMTRKVTTKPFASRPLNYVRSQAEEAGLIVWTNPVTGLVRIDEPAALLAEAQALPAIRLARLPNFPGNNVLEFAYKDDKARKMNTCLGVGAIRTEADLRTPAATQSIPAWAPALPLPFAQPPTDAQLAAYRPMVLELRNTSAAELIKRTRRELNLRRAQAHVLSYTVAGWTDRTGLPYGPCRMAEVADAKRGIYGRDFVRACRFHYTRENADGRKTTLDLVDPGVLA